MKHDLIEILLPIILLVWISICGFINMGIIASLVFVLLVILCSTYSSTSALGVMIGMLYIPTACVNLPNPFIIALFIIVITNAKKIIRPHFGKFFKTPIIASIVYLFWRFCSIIVIKDEAIFIKYITIDITWLICIYVAASLIDNKTNIPNVMKIWGLVGVLTAITGYLHFTYYDHAYWTQLFKQSGLIDKGATEDSMYQRIRWIAAGVEPNFHGLIMLVPYGFLLCQTIKKTNISNCIFLIIAILGVFGTFSRSSFISAIIMALIAASKPKYIIYIIIGGIIAYFAVSYYMPDYFLRIESINTNLEKLGGSGRFDLWLEGWGNFQNHPLFGVGAGQTKLYSSHNHETHNLYLQVLSENALIGFLILVVLLFKPLIDIYKAGTKYRNFLVVISGIMINMCTVSFFDLRIFMYIILMFYAFRYYSNKNNLSHTRIITTPRKITT